VPRMDCYRESGPGTRCDGDDQGLMLLDEICKVLKDKAMDTF